MTDKDYHYFYEYFVNASAAYLTNKEGYIVARTIIFNKVYDAASGRVWRLAERQYSTEDNNVLHRILVDELIKGGHIDGYKQIGAGCSDSRAFVDNEGNSLSDKTFYIDCNIGYGDTLSYQDSFKWLDMDAQRAYNKNLGYNSTALDTTEGEIDGEDESEYDSYHDEYVYEVFTVYVEGREETCDSSRLGDFKYVNGEWYHVNDIETCARCGNDYVADDGYFSELTEEHYCDQECYTYGEDDYKEANWHWSEFDEEWFEDESSVVRYMRWSRYLNAYEENTISVESLNEKVDAGEFYLIDDTYYNAIDTEKMLPFNHAA
ncbi:MAG: hypothetical protein SNJ29_13690 [Rikenellaceae bacterium]